jgi:hypothetical protein
VDVPAATLSGYVGVYDLVDADNNKTVAVITLTGSTLALDYDGKGKETAPAALADALLVVRNDRGVRCRRRRRTGDGDSTTQKAPSADRGRR